MNRPERSSLAAILLAAGPSSRLGQPKQLVRLEGECLVRRMAGLLSNMGLASVTVVSGCEAERVEAELRDLPVTIVHNRSWEEGMGSSIACGARSLPDGLNGVLISVCDQWHLREADLSALISAWLSDISRICTACWHEGEAFVSGPPVIFPRKVIPELKYLFENRGARQVIDLHMDIVEFVEIENAAFDLDRPEDLDRLRGGS